MKVNTELGFDFKGQEYLDLFGRSDATAFQSPSWLSSFYGVMVPAQSAQSCIITFRQEGKLEGLVALIKRRKFGVMLLEATDLGVSDYAAPVLTPQLIKQLGESGEIQNAFRKALGEYDVLRIRPSRQQHCDAWQLLTGSSPQILNFSAHSIDLQSPFEDWRTQNLDPKMASMAARKSRRWRKQHAVSMERLEDAASIMRAVENLSQLRKGRFEGDQIQQQQISKFYAQAAVSGAKLNEAETWVLSSDGHIACILFGLTHNGRFLYLLIGADYETHGRHSPGLQMYEGVIEDWMKRGGINFDFTIGDEPFKQQYGTQAEPMSLFLKAGSFKGSMALKLMRKRMVR